MNSKTELLLNEYERLRCDTYVSSLRDFPSSKDFPSHPSWMNVIDLTRKNIDKIKNDFIDQISQLESLEDISLLWMISFLKEIDDIEKSQKETLITSYEEFEDSVLSKYIDEKNYFYRGVTNKNYDLVPYLYRKLEIEKLMVDFDELEKHFHSTKEKYDQVFEYKNEWKIRMSEASYIASRNPDFVKERYFNFLAYLQHSMSPTLLLDVSKSILVSSSFSTQKISKNPAIYIFNPEKSQIVKKDDIDGSFYTNYRINYRKGKIKPDSTIFKKPLWKIKKSDLTTKFLLFDPFDDTFCMNDRMKYQHGCFLIPIHGVIANNKILTDFEENKITKIVLNRNTAKAVKKKIEKEYPYYQYKFLMNPYLYFKKEKKCFLQRFFKK